MAALQQRAYPVELFNSAHSDGYTAVVYSKAYSNKDYEEARALKKTGVKVAVDLCDNHLYNPKGLPYWTEAGSRLRRMLALADAVTVSTDALARTLSDQVQGLRPPTIIGDAVETDIRCDSGGWWSRWRSKRRLIGLRREIERDRAEDRVPLVWFGSHGSPYAEGGMLDLVRIQDVLEKVAQRHPLSLTVISNSRRTFLSTLGSWRIPAHYMDWHPSTFLRALTLHEIAVIPSTDNPFTRCKTNNRLALALAMGLAVVADPVPSYEPFSGVARIGDWEQALDVYVSNPAVRARDVNAGRELVFRDWSIERIADRWQQFFDDLRE
jgi:hypothetical protein